MGRGVPMLVVVVVVVVMVVCFTATHCLELGLQQLPLAPVGDVEFIVTQEVGVPYATADSDNETVEVDELEEVEGLSEVDGLSTVGGDAKVERTIEAVLTPHHNLQPVIGILTQEISRRMNEATDGNYTSYLAASYVKYMESGGARVVPIMINKDEDYYRGIFNAVSGVVFPGGAASFKSEDSGYGRAGSLLYDLVREAKEKNNTEVPILAICLGFEMLLFLDANKTNPLTRCSASSVADPLYLKPGYNTTELIGRAPDDVLQTLTTTNSTSNFHKYCVTPQTFLDLGLERNFTLVSTSYDRSGLEYISTVEHRRMPVYGTQWHPEKNLFEWAFSSIPHDRDSIRSSQYIGNTFVQKARLNGHKYSSRDADLYPLIYSYNPVYIRKLYKSSFQQVYLFK